MDELKLRGSGITDDIHPLISCVLYLDDGGSSKAPTIVIKQRLVDTELPEDAWSCSPKANRLLAFDGSLLHGVVPYLNTDDEYPSSDLPRVTLMLGWWHQDVVKSTECDICDLKPNMPMPASTRDRSSSSSWVDQMNKDIELIPISERRIIENGNLERISGPIWEAVSEFTVNHKSNQRIDRDSSYLRASTISNGAQLKDKIGRRSAEFVGNWFLKEPTAINDEIRSGEIKNKPNSNIKISAEDCIEWISIADLQKLRA